MFLIKFLMHEIKIFKGDKKNGWLSIKPVCTCN